MHTLTRTVTGSFAIAGPGQAARVLAAGLVVGVLSVVNGIAYAGLIYGGALAGGMAAGIAVTLLGIALSAIILALGSSHPGMVSSPIATTAVAYPLIAATVHAALPPGLDAETRVLMISLVCGLVTVATGLAFLMTGFLRLGSLARLLPYPVISGYNAGSGWLFIVGAFGITGGGSHGAGIEATGHISTALFQIVGCVLLGLLMVGISRRLHHWSVVPVLLLGGALAYHLFRLASGMDVGQAVEAGWLLGPFPPGRIWATPIWGQATEIPWPALSRLMAPTGTIILLGGTSAIMFLTGIELELHRRLNLDREMAVNGIANIVGGAVGGIATSHSVTGTSLTHRMGAEHRMVGVVAAACCIGTLVLGSETLSLVPRFVVAALLFANGADRLIDRVLLDRVKLPLHEWVLALSVLLAVISLGYVQGVGIGLGLTLVIFAMNYRRISVIRGISSGVAHRSSVVRSVEAQSILVRDGGGIRVCRLQGYLFFLNASEVLQAVLRMTQQPVRLRVLILDFQHVVGMDTSACLVFRQLHQLAGETGFSMMLTALPPPVQAQFALQRVAIRRPPELAHVETTDLALQHAEDMLLLEAGVTQHHSKEDLAELLSQTLHVEVTRDRLAPYIEHVSFPAGSVLMRQGDEADAMYFIEQGRVCAQLERGGSPPIRLRSSTAGTIVGEIGIYAGGRRTATVVAEEDCVAVRIAVGAIARMERSEPALTALLQRFLTIMLAEKLSDTNRMLERALD